MTKGDGMVLQFPGGLMPLGELVQKVSTNCEETMAQIGRVDAMYHAIARNGEHYVFHPPARHQSTARTIIRELFRKWDIVTYVFCGEAWMVERDDDFVGPVPEQTDDRIAIVAITGEAETEKSVTGYRKIIRERGKRPKLAPFNDDLVPIGGELVSMLPAKGKLQ